MRSSYGKDLRILFSNNQFTNRHLTWFDCKPLDLLYDRPDEYRKYLASFLSCTCMDIFLFRSFLYVATTGRFAQNIRSTKNPALH